MGNYNMNAGYGQMLVMQLASTMRDHLGQVLVVLEDSDNNDIQRQVQETFELDPYGRVRFFRTLEAAYDKAVSNNNDVIALSAHSSHTLSTSLTISKNRCHFVGLDGGGRLLQQGTKIQNGASDSTAFLIKNNGVRNSFRNIKFIQSSTNANALTVYQEGGEGTLIENSSITFGAANNLSSASASEIVFGGDSCTYRNVTFGQDTLLTSAARTIFLIDQVNGFECKSNRFVDCEFLGSSSNAGMQAISMAAAGDILFTNHFIRPSFIASIDSAGGIACTKAVSTQNNTVKGTILISYPMVHGFNDIGINGTNNDNLYVFSHVPSAVDITSAKPTTT